MIYNISAGRDTLYTRVTELTFKRYCLVRRARAAVRRFFVMKSFFVLLEKSAKFPSSFIKQFFDISYAVANAALVISGIQPSFWSCLR